MGHFKGHLSIGLNSDAILAPSDEFILAAAVTDKSVAGDITDPFANESYTIAQAFDQDVLGDIKDGFTNFVETGQVWALVIGLVLGYLIRGITR